MAVNHTILKRYLLVNVENGVNEDGTFKTKSITFSGIRKDAAMADIYNAGAALAGLMDKNAQSFGLSEKGELSSQG